MSQSDPNSSSETNPYQSPVDVGLDIPPASVANALPPLHWPRTIIIFVVLFVAGLATYGTTLPFAFAILFGGLRTALIYRACESSMRVPPSYLGSTILSPILCFIFQIATGATFFFVCASRFALDRPMLSEQLWLIITGIIALGVFIMLYLLSIKVAVASCRPIQS